MIKQIEGKWVLFADAWMDLGEQAGKMALTLTHHDREVYRVMDCDNPNNNDIELQLGIN